MAQGCDPSEKGIALTLGFCLWALHKAQHGRRGTQPEQQKTRPGVWGPETAGLCATG